MISSVVIIPEDQPALRPPSSPSLKRRQSSLDADANKRPRLEGVDSAKSTARNGSGHALEPSSPTHRKSSTIGTGVAEERKRGQRLFGALLGTLSQKSSKPVHKRRDEIEQRQRDRLRKDNEEREAEGRQKQEERNRIRRIEQKAWDRTSAELRHRNMRAVANFLQTKAEPRLYYRPWDLRPEEEDQIKRQIEEVEEVVKREAREYEDDDGETEVASHLSAEASATQKGGGRQSSPDHANSSNDGNDSRDILLPTKDIISPGGNDNENNTNDRDINQAERMSQEPQEVVNTVGNETEDSSSTIATMDQPETSKEEDHEGEELVEGQEDDVMY